MNPREIAYLALLASLRGESYLNDFLSRHPLDNESDAHLAREIAYGSSRMALTLDFIAGSLAEGTKLSLKRKEWALLRTALYQHYFLERIPDYAIVNESVSLAKKYCSSHFAKFLNAILRKMPNASVSVPKNNLSVRYSYPPDFVSWLIRDYGVEKAIEVMDAGNQPAKTMVRLRPGIDVREVERGSEIECLAQSPDVYIQNATPAYLIGELRKGMAIQPKCILDLSASPGGKLIAVHDLFPEAKLTANDVSEEKMIRLKENLNKFKIDAVLSTGLGEEFKGGLFDLIIVDAPCSNSGVLNKRPEARWRLNKENVKKLISLQKKLIDHALTLLVPGGEVWYMTCSILKDENENLVKPYTIRTSTAILPNRQGWDGGFGCALKK